MILSLNDGIAILVVCITVVSIITSIIVYNIFRFGICCLLNRNNRHTFIETRTVDSLLDNSFQVEMNVPNELPAPNTTYKLKNISEDCPICLCEMKDTVVIQFDCLHKYHEKCILEWWKSEYNNNYSCVMCNN